MSKEEVEATLPWMMVDFGARGVMEPIYTGLGHLMSFSASDNMEATYAVNQVYNAAMSSHSIPASEHSIMTLMGRSGEATMAEKIVDEYGPQGRPFAMVMDSYDIDNFIDNTVGKRLKEKIVRYGTKCGAKFIGRPDSGDPTEMLPHVVQRFMDIFGFTTVGGFDRLPPYVGSIQGDGIDRHSAIQVMKACTWKKFAATNYCFGSGGGLLQQFNRDTLKFAQKLSAVENKNGWYDTCKDPKDAHWKASKAGRVGAYWVHGERFLKCFTAKEVGVMSKAWISDGMMTYYLKTEGMREPLIDGEDWAAITARIRNFDGLVL
jgi:nicotinamide phosphoribosyltransferase